MSINKLILKYLKDNKISQFELSKRTSISPQNLNRLLNADDIKLSQLLSISEGLGLPTTYFLEEQPVISKQEIEDLKKRNIDLERKLEDRTKSFRSSAWVISVLAKEAQDFILDKNMAPEQFLDTLRRMENGFEAFEHLIKDNL